MKTFARHKTYDEIKAQCLTQGLRLNDRLYRKMGWDTIVVGGPIVTTWKPGDPAYVIYNTFNGKFHGVAPSGLQFTSSDAHLDGDCWFQALLSFFYVEKAAEPAARQPT